MNKKFNQEYFRYLLKSKGIKIKEVASLCDLSDRQFNRLIRTESIKLVHVNKILNLLGLEYQEVFRFE